MRNNKIIDPSLNKKISQNEKRIQDLFNANLNKSKSIRLMSAPGIKQPAARNFHHKKNKSQDEIYISSYKKGNVNNLKSTIDHSTYYKTIQYEGDDDSIAFMNRMKKRINQNGNNEKEEKKNNKIFHTTVNNVYKKMKEKNKKKVYSKAQLNNVVDRLYNNDYKHKKKPKREVEKETSTIDFSIKTDSMETPVKKKNQATVDVDEMIERFEKDIKNRNKKIEKKREEIKVNEKKLYTYKPVLNKQSKKYESSNNESFLERQKKYDEKMKKKEEKYKEDLKKSQQEKLYKDSYLSKKHNKKENEGETKANNKENIDKMIKSLYDWENQRKKKIENKQKEKSGAAETKFDYMPKINKRSNSMVKKNKNRKMEPDVFSRLSKEDKMLKEKRQILMELYTPSFKPNVITKKERKKKKEINENNNNDDELNHFNKEISKKKKAKNKYSSDSDSDEEDEEEDDDEEEEEEDDEEEKEDNFDFKQDPKIYVEDNVQNKFRNAFLNKIKKGKA